MPEHARGLRSLVAFVKKLLNIRRRLTGSLPESYSVRQLFTSDPCPAGVTGLYAAMQQHAPADRNLRRLAHGGLTLC
jgi:hypothetical protein